MCFFFIKGERGRRTGIDRILLVSVSGFFEVCKGATECSLMLSIAVNQLMIRKSYFFLEEYEVRLECTKGSQVNSVTIFILEKHDGVKTGQVV